MTDGWFYGIGSRQRVFINDRVANSLRNSAGVIKARNDFYKTGRQKDFILLVVKA